MQKDNKTPEEIVEENNASVQKEQPELDESLKDLEARDESMVAEDDGTALKEAVVNSKSRNAVQKIWGRYTANKKVAIPVTLALILAILFAVPITRYPLLGLVIKKDVNVIIIDTGNNLPVSGADVQLRGRTAKTDGEGRAIIKNVPVGTGELTATKKYYQDTRTTVLVGLTPKDTQVSLQATGRQIPLRVVNKITGQPIADATIAVLDTTAQTDQNGESTLVLPPTEKTIEAKLQAAGFNDTTVTVTIADATIATNTFGMVSEGKVYFLSKLTGKIDVVKTDLDGSNRQTVLAGTGNEEDTNTVLLAARDWKYLALHARREGSKPRLYLLDTSNDSLAEIDSSEAVFTPVGWSDHNFVYKVLRDNVQPWQPKAAALKTYNAESKRLVTIDETNAEGSGLFDYANEALDTVYIQKEGLVYAKTWSANFYSMNRLVGKRMGIYAARADGSNKQLIKDFDTSNNGYITAASTEPQEIYFGVYNGPETFYEYENSKLTETKAFDSSAFNKFYPTFLVSPSGRATFWHEPRDGKNSLFVGNAAGEDSKEVATLSDYTPYGWYSDDYTLVSKNNSELYIQPTGGAAAPGQLIKISDYHKPNVSFYNYGYGYGGL